AERLLASDPTAEPAHRALMRIRAARGHENAALRQFETCRAALKKYLGVEPEAQTQSLAASLQTRGGNRPTASTRDTAQPVATPSTISAGRRTSISPTALSRRSPPRFRASGISSSSHASPPSPIRDASPTCARSAGNSA
ncbi:MAG: hypothetical protein E5V88_16145, partial [Mesorhizobium sp.]